MEVLIGLFTFALKKIFWGNFFKFWPVINRLSRKNYAKRSENFLSYFANFLAKFRYFHRTKCEKMRIFRCNEIFSQWCDFRETISSFCWKLLEIRRQQTDRPNEYRIIEISSDFQERRWADMPNVTFTFDCTDRPIGFYADLEFDCMVS